MFRYLQPGICFSVFSMMLTIYITGVRAETQEIQLANESESENMEFDASFLNGDNGEGIDLSRFSSGSSGTPGTYKTALYINNEFISNSDIEFRSRDDKTVYPCLSHEILKNITFNRSRLPSDFLMHTEAEQNCIDLSRQLSDAKVNYDSNEQRLDILIPDIYIQKIARGTVNPELWDSGIPALMLGYNINSYTSESRGETYNSQYAGLNAGLNVGAWYLRHNGTYTRMGNGSHEYNSINTYLQRDVPILRARTLLGQANTNGEIFDTLPFTGIQLATDERMLPESLRGYAPEIRGIARTNARVIVRQGGQILYETTVTPGEFLINDLYPTGYGGDLNVTVHENDGTEQTFNVPYAAVAQLLRPGASRFSVTAGELRSDTLHDTPALYQGTLHYGLTNAVTLYGGLQLSQNYYALRTGTALGTSVGAFALDVTQARTHLKEKGSNADNTSSGQSYQVSYSKLINETNSNFSLAAYRFSTNGYMDFMTAMQTRDAIASGMDASSISRAKNRMTLTVGQGLPQNWGQLYLSGSMQTYWNKAGRDTQYQLGYNNRYGRLSYGLMASRTYSNLGATQTSYLLSFSLPLGRDNQIHTPHLRTDLAYNSDGRTSQQLSVSGTAGEDSQYSYGVSAMKANQGAGSSGSLTGNYRSPVTSITGSVSASQDYRSASAGLSGAVVAHAGGLTFSPYTADTFALIEAKGAEGARASSYPGVRIDSRGYAIVPYLNPYQMNDISIDPKGMSDEVELISSSHKVAPYAGAVVKVKYDTKRGIPLLIYSTWQGEPVPFGADVKDSNGNSVGVVGQAGQIYARVADEKGKLRIAWGEDEGMQCMVGYQLMPSVTGKEKKQLQQFNSECY